MSTAIRFYVTGGTLHPEAPSYVRRRADDELYSALTGGEFCYVLTARQMGKSSLMARTAARLRAEGVAVAALDLSALGQNLTVEQWYYGLLLSMAQQLRLKAELREFWRENAGLGPLRRWIAAIEEVVLPACSGKLVLSVDELDLVRSLPFSTDEFFAAIRECYNRRIENPELRRLTFCLLGVATPAALIADPRLTPFNIGRRIDVDDFNAEEARCLAIGLALGEEGLAGRPIHEARELLERVLYWTGGQPYLTQRLCQAIAADPGAPGIRGVDAACRALFLSSTPGEEHDHFDNVRNVLLQEGTDRAGLLELYARILRGETIPEEEADPLLDLLRLSGLVRVAGGRATVRNRIYRQVFDVEWIREHMPEAELRRQRIAYRCGIRRAASAAAAILLVVGGLAFTAVSKGLQSQEMLARMQLERGVQRLQEGDATGLLDLVEARKTAALHPALRSSVDSIWAGWHAGLAGRLFQVVGHDAAITALTFGPDGRLLATGAADGTVRLWDTRSWQPRTDPLSCGVPVSYLAFSPDGARLAAGAAAAIRLWDTGSGRLLGRAVDCPSRVRGIAFRPDGSAVLAWGREWARIWNTAGQPGPSLPTEVPMKAFVFGPRDSHLLAVASAKRVVLCDARTGRPVGPPVSARDPLSMEFSGDGSRLAVADLSGVRLWDTQGRSAPVTLLQPVAEDVQFSRDSGLVASTSGNVVQLWEARTGHPRGFPLTHPFPVGQALFVPGKRGLLATRSGSDVYLWQTATGERYGQPIRTPSGAAIALDPSGALVAVGSEQGAVQVWRVEQPTRGLWFRSEKPQGAVTFIEGGRVVAAASKSEVCFWDARTGREWGGRLQLAPPYPPRKFSPDGTLLAAYDGDAACLWDIAAGRRLVPPLRAPGAVRSIAFSPDSARLVLGSSDRTIRIWKTAHPRPLTGPLRTAVFPRELVFSPDGRVMAVVGDGGVELRQPADGRLLHMIPRLEGPVTWAAFTPDSRLVATAAGRTLTFWDVSTGRRRGAMVECPAQISCAAISGQGTLLAIGAGDHLVRIWDLRRRRMARAPFLQLGRIETLAFSPDGRTLVGTGGDALQVWDVETGQPCARPLAMGEPITSSLFSPDGGSVLARTRYYSYLLPLPPPPPDTEEMERRTWVATGVRRRLGDVEVIPGREWRRLKAETGREN